jgi:serine/threonine-protein kinase
MPPPRPSTMQPGISPQMDQVIATGMAKNPDHRYATTKDLAVAARAALTAPIPHAPPAPFTSPPPAPSWSAPVPYPDTGPSPAPASAANNAPPQHNAPPQPAPWSPPALPSPHKRSLHLPGGTTPPCGFWRA